MLIIPLFRIATIPRYPMIRLSDPNTNPLDFLPAVITIWIRKLSRLLSIIHFHLESP